MKQPLNPDQFKKYCDNLRLFEQAYGNVKNSNDFGMNELEANYRKFTRRNVISARNIEIGEVVSIDDFDFKRSFFARINF